MKPESAARLRLLHERDLEGITAAPGYAYERAPEQRHFLNRTRTKQLFRDIRSCAASASGGSASPPCTWIFLAGNQTYKCTPWSTPTRNVFIGSAPATCSRRGYAKSFGELMQTTAWDRHGTGNYEKCADYGALRLREEPRWRTRCGGRGRRCG